ncbi:MAG: hypothetical protein AAF990_01820 [Bacteroidota bacterium]
MKRILTFIGLTMLLCPQLFAQLPVDNPYLTDNPQVQDHWTQSIPWDKVTNATKVKGLIRKNKGIDSINFVKIAKEIVSKGGGVLYFPRGTYYVYFNLELPSGLVIRGQAPNFEPTDVKRPGLPTRFVFPKFNPYVGGQKVPRNFDGTLWESCRVRKIQKADGVLKSAGLVHLDINRTIINFSGKPFDRAVDAKLLKKGCENVLLYGLRLNNGALPDPAVPSDYAKAHENDWQNWPWEKVANINLLARKNVLLANCLFNNKPTDNYRQNNYKLDDGMTFDGFEAMYKFSDHPAIAINHPADPKVAAKAENLEAIELKDNHILVTKGNEGIVFPGVENLLETNQTNTIEEEQNVVIRGRYATAYDYNILHRETEMSKPFVHTNSYKDTLPYRLIEPKEKEAGKKYPLVLFLHDFTSKGEDNHFHLRHFIWQLAQDSIREKYPCYIVAPHLTTEEVYWRGRYNFSLTWPLYSSVQIVDKIIRDYPVDVDRVYVIGTGIGGDAVWDLTIFYPNKFAAAACLGGQYHFTPIAAKQIAHIPYWLIWGDEDEWLPKERKIITTMDLKLLGAPMKVVNLKNTGKKCWNNIFEDVPDFLPAFFQQRRNNTLSAK